MAGGGCPGRLAPVLLLALLWPGRAAAEVSELRDKAVARGAAAAAARPGAERGSAPAPRWHRAALATGEEGKVNACVSNNAPPPRQVRAPWQGEVKRGEVHLAQLRGTATRTPLPGGDENGREGPARGTASPPASGASRPSS